MASSLTTPARAPGKAARASSGQPRFRRLVQGVCLGWFLVLFFVLAWPYGGRIDSERFALRDLAPLELFLWLDPLSALAAATAGRSVFAALGVAAGVLAACAVWPRAFCGYVCPLGTLQDVFEWLAGGRAARFRLKNPGAWSGLRFGVLLAVLTAAALGVMLAGFLAAIPLLTRGLMFSAGWLQVGLMKNWGLAGSFTFAAGLAALLPIGVLGLGLLAPRFWCRCVCPTGALLSLAGLAASRRRQVETICSRCGSCVEACPFGAVNDDASTRPLDCAYCQTCASVCPTGSIHFGPAQPGRSAAPAGLTGNPLSRRAWLGSAVAGAGAAIAIRAAGAAPVPPVRPPGSVPEDRFLDLCIRCGECFKVCPGGVLQPAGFDRGLEAFWTPVVTPTQAGCHQDCNYCTQVCPTGAIRRLSLAEKRKFHIGVARIDPQVCLPHAGVRDCQLCHDECVAAGYNAIEMRPVRLATGEVPAGAFSPEEIEAMSSIQAPFVKAEACVGCGLCEYRCHAGPHRRQNLIPRRAVVVVAQTA